ncbi:MAG: TlpA family protein disulfide reductase, partial [Lachnospiraceae bacterium]|nr:TlpA family protein disulfide reductase [Lachnospiraceae bacterium]
MKSRKAIIIGAIALVVIIAIVVAVILLSGDGKKDGSQGGEEKTTSSVENGTKGTYTVSVKTQGGMVMPEIDVYVYADDTLTDLKEYKSTNEDGIVTFDLPVSDDYAIALTGTPKGYQVEKSYKFSGNTAVISLKSSIITDGDISGAKLGLGDVMYDMTVKTSDGEEIKISDLLKEKKMVMLNFWYTTCQYCVEEFPFMEEAYQKYKDDIEIVALNHLDDVDAIKSFKSSMGLSFPMATCNSTFPQNVFGVSGWPTSVVIDRYGVICMVEAGGILSLRPFINMFDHFTAEDYQQKLC